MNQKKTVPIILAIIWLIIVLWQAAEHNRYKDYARTALLNRAEDITNSLGTVIRSQRAPRFMGGIVSKERLEAALQDLMELSELKSIALLNAMGEVVTSAGDPNEYDIHDLPETGERWEEKRVTFVNLVDLGADPSKENNDEQPTLIMQRPNPDDGPPRGSRPDWSRRNPSSSTDTIDFASGGPDFRVGDPRNGFPGPERFSRENLSATDMINIASEIISRNIERDRRGGRDRGRGGRPSLFGRPIPEELKQKQGLHGFLLVLSTKEYNNSLDKDIWMRIIICGFSLLAVAGIGLAWRNLYKSSELQLRLIRASEMNTHLREMNVAAAGLAHETRNPLNIVRGLAQMITKQGNIPNDVKDRSLKITEEVDRVTAQLNEFIDYSKPREPKTAPVIVQSVVTDVERALRSDMEDKEIQFVLSGNEISVEADESLLRQVVFNLLLNSIQSVHETGNISITVDRASAADAYLEIRDNGPGVSKDNQDKIFQPYFTTHEKGTGLGLAVVRQIVLSHGWTLDYIESSEGGATFRVNGMKIVTKVNE